MGRRIWKWRLGLQWSSCCWLKYIVTTWKQRVIYLVGMFRTPSLGDSISVALRKLLQGGRSRGVRPYITLQQREQAVWTSKIRCQVKQFCILCMERCKPLGPLNSFLSYATQLSGTKFCFLVHLKEWQMAASCNPPASQQSLWRVAASAGSQFGEPSLTFGDQKSLMAVKFLVYWYGRRYFHSTNVIPSIKE